MQTCTGCYEPDAPTQLYFKIHSSTFANMVTNDSIHQMYQGGASMWLKSFIPTAYFLVENTTFKHNSVQTYGGAVLLTGAARS